ncbi:MAG: bacterio-opsin activator domain-containing protein [Haloarculaceae archaeon]
MTHSATVLIVGSERGLASAFEAIPHLDVQVLTVPSVEHVAQTQSTVGADILVVPETDTEFPDTSTVHIADNHSITVTDVCIVDDSPWWHAVLATRIEAVLAERHEVSTGTVTKAIADAFGDTEYPSRGNIGRRAVSVLTDTFVLPHAIVALLDEAEGVLSPVAMSPASRAAAGTGTFGSDNMCVWRAFSKAETTVISEEKTPGGAKCAVVTPLGDNGVLIAGTSHASDIDEQTVSAVELLATTTRLAFDRQQSDRDRQEAEQQLENQRERLERVVDINDKVRKMDQALIQAETRTEVERRVCERLLTSDRFTFVWVGEPSPDGTSVNPRSIAGDSQGYLDSISLALDQENITEPALHALETGEVTIVSHVSGRNLHEEEWREEALLRDFRAVASIPLVHGEVIYGVVTVYANVPAAFDTLAVSVLSEMGETIGYAIDTAEQKRALNSNVVTELTITLPAPDDVFTRLARQFDTPFIVDGFAARADNKTIVYGTLPKSPAREVVATASNSPVVERTRTIPGTDDRFEFVVDGSPLLVVLADLGTTPERFTTVDDRVKTTVTVPDQTAVRTVVERLANTYGNATVQAQRTRDQLSSPLSEAVADLTDRQREVFETAYYSGYFEWPREQNGEEIAETLGISQPAFLQHLRACERKLVANVFEQD